MSEGRRSEDRIPKPEAGKPKTEHERLTSRGRRVKGEQVAGEASVIEAVIFDMDGVLIDSEPIHFEATRELLADLGIDYVADLDENFFGCTDRDVFHALRARYGLEADEGQLSAAWVARSVALLSGPLVPMRGVPDVLHALRRLGIRLALASSSAPPVIAATLNGLGLSSLFEFTVSGHDVERGKPAPDIFVKAARGLQVRSEALLIVEDSFNGLSAAVAAGIRCVAVPCPSTARQDFTGAAARLGDLTELPPWLEANGLVRRP
jgi:HAD superfamily hydrolase (TIGR01509 family)